MKTGDRVSFSDPSCVPPWTWFGTVIKEDGDGTLTVAWDDVRDYRGRFVTAGVPEDGVDPSTLRLLAVSR